MQRSDTHVIPKQQISPGTHGDNGDLHSGTGEAVGDDEGTFVGDDDGTFVGENVGASVGNSVGALTGAVVTGASVGDPVIFIFEHT